MVLELIRPYRRFLHAFYVVNFMVIASYSWVRNNLLDLRVLTRETEQIGLPMESQISMMLVIILGMKLRKAISIDHFIATLFRFTKVAILGFCYYSDMRAVAWYMVLFLVLWLTLTQPEYEGETAVTLLRGHTFEEEVENDKSGAFTLVEFYTTWASDCAQFTPLFASLSLRYSSDNLKFAKIDVGIASTIAETYDIDLDPMTTKQLPTLMLFQYGKYVKPFRLPFIDENGSLKKCPLNEYNINKVFELEARQMQRPAKARAAAASKKAASSSKAKGPAKKKSSNNKKVHFD